MIEHSLCRADSKPDSITAKEAAALYGCTPEYIARLCRSGEVKGYMEGRLWYVSKESFSVFSAKKGKAKDVRAKRLSRERKKEYGTSEDHAALYGAIFEAMAALPRLKAAPVAAAKRRTPLHRRAAVERGIAALIALVAVFGNYALMTSQGGVLAAEARSSIHFVQSISFEGALVSLERTEGFTHASAGVGRAIDTAWSAFGSKIGEKRMSAPQEGAELMRPQRIEEPAEEATSTAQEVITAKTVHAETLCIGSTCLTENTILELTNKR